MSNDQTRSEGSNIVGTDIPEKGNPSDQRENERTPSLSSTDRRRSSDEWDASKVPPSRFQKRKGSIYATPGSRDGHVDRNFAADFYEKHTQRGYGSSNK